MRTIMLIQSIEHSYIVSRKYTNLNWQNNTQVFLTNPCFLKKTVHNISGDTLTHPKKTWICHKKLYFTRWNN